VIKILLALFSAGSKGYNRFTVFLKTFFFLVFLFSFFLFFFFSFFLERANNLKYELEDNDNK